MQIKFKDLVNAAGNPQDYATRLLLEEQTVELCLDAVKSDGSLLRFVKDQTPEIVAAALEENPQALGCVESQTDEMCKDLLAKDESLLRYVRRQTPELCNLAVRRIGKGFPYIKDFQGVDTVPESFIFAPWVIEGLDIPPQLMEKLLDANPAAISYMKDVPEKLKIKAVSWSGGLLEDIEDQTEAVILAAVKNKGMAIVDAKFQTTEISVAAVKSDWRALQYVMTQNQEICQIALASHPEALKWVKNPTRAMCLEAVTKRGELICWVPKAFYDNEMLCAAIDSDPSSLVYMKGYQTPELALRAIEKDPGALHCVDYTMFPDEIYKVNVC